MKGLITLYSIVGLLLFSSCTREDGIFDTHADQSEFSKTVSIKEACDIANVFNFQHYGILESRATQNQSVQPIKNISGREVAYVVNREPGGWIIISATKDFYPILAYSDSLTGMLDLSLENINSGLSIWIEEVTEAIQYSNSFDEQTSKAIAAQWKGLEAQITASGGPGLPGGNSQEAVKCRNRLKQLNETYSKEGWKFQILTNISDIVLPDEVYSTADWLGSPYEYTIVGIRDVTNYLNILPIVKSKWNQTTYSSNGNPVGCVPIAMAQIMRKHKFPEDIPWDKMLDDTPTDAAISFIADIRSTLGMSGTGATVNEAFDGFKYYGYSVVKKDHYSQDVINQLVAERPVYMRGDNGKLLPAFGYEGHAWVCDGVIRNMPEYEYYVEYLNSVKEYTNYGMTLIENPGKTAGISYTMFHMNWGWGGSSDGWYTATDMTPANYDFNSNRQNLYVQPNKS